MKWPAVLALMAGSLVSLFAPAVSANDFSLPEAYWPQGFAWDVHVYSGWTGASIFRPGRTDPKEMPVLQFSTPGITPGNRVGGRIHETAELAIQFQDRIKRLGPVARSVPDADCQEGWSNEGIDRGIRWSSGLQFNCRIGRMTFYVDLRSQSNHDPEHSGAMLNEAVPLSELHDVATRIVSGFRRYAADEDLLEAIDRLSAALFPDPATERPDGWWWAKSAGATYELHGRPQPAEGSATPLWTQTIEVGRAGGYVFKQYRPDGSGSWCRPEKNGKCDLPYQRVNLGIYDFLVHGGQDACLQSLGASGADRKTTRGSNPDQAGVHFCRNGFYVTVNTVGQNEPAVASVAEFYADVIARHMDGRASVSVAPPSSDMPGAAGAPSAPPQSAPASGYPGVPAADGGGWSDTGTAVLTAAGAAAGAGLAGIGAWLMLGQAGIGRREALEGLGDLMRGQLPDDGFDAWTAKYEAMGWTYREENGIAVFDPPKGYGATVSPPDMPPISHRDGDINADTGEVWSEEDGGWIGRNLYEQEKRRASDIAAIEVRSAERIRLEDEKTRALGRAVADAERERKELEAVFDARRTLEDAIDGIWKRDLDDGTLDANRRAFLAGLERKAEELSLSKDRPGAIADMLDLADIVGHQAREGFKPTYTYRDAVFDTTIQTGAAALDAVLTRGYASSAVGSSLAMRDAARDGKSGTEILYEGAKAAVFDFVIGKTADLVGHAAGAAHTAWREAGEAMEEAAHVAARLKGATQAGGDLLAETERNLNRLRQNLARDGAGRPRAKLEDVLDVQRTPHQVRNLKQTGTQELQDGFNNTLRSEIYKPHDRALVQRLKESHPDLADRKVVVHEFRTPGKGSSGINTDRDFRVLYKNDNGDWIEVPRSRWEKDSHDIFGELTGYDPAKCPPDIPDAQKQAWWAEQHGHTATDRSFREACPDYSDQVINEVGERVRVGKPRIQELKEIASGKVDLPAQPVRLRDPASIGSQFDEKIAGNLRRGDPFEAVAQAQKGVDTLDAVRNAYDAQGIAAGSLPDNFGRAMDLIRASNLPAKPDAKALAALQDGLGKLGFGNLDAFGKALSSQFESLKFAR